MKNMVVCVEPSEKPVFHSAPSTRSIAGAAGNRVSLAHSVLHLLLVICEMDLVL